IEDGESAYPYRAMKSRTFHGIVLSLGLHRHLKRCEHDRDRPRYAEDLQAWGRFARAEKAHRYLVWRGWNETILSYRRAAPMVSRSPPMSIMAISAPRDVSTSRYKSVVARLTVHPFGAKSAKNSRKKRSNFPHPKMEHKFATKDSRCRQSIRRKLF